MGSPTVLAYGFTSPAVKKLRGVCEKLGIRLRRVLPEESGRPVGGFVGREKLPHGEAAAEDTGEMLVLCDVSERQLEALLSSLRTARVGQDALKAVLTDTNARWTGWELYQELQKERAELDG